MACIRPKPNRNDTTEINRPVRCEGRLIDEVERSRLPLLIVERPDGVVGDVPAVIGHEESYRCPRAVAPRPNADRARLRQIPVALLLPLVNPEPVVGITPDVSLKHRVKLARVLDNVFFDVTAGDDFKWSLENDAVSIFLVPNNEHTDNFSAGFESEQRRRGDGGGFAAHKLNPFSAPSGGLIGHDNNYLALTQALDYLRGDISFRHHIQKQRSLFFQ